MDSSYEPVGIISGVEGLIELLLHHTEIQEAVILDQLTFYRGLINNRRVVLVRCGVGKVNAAQCAALLIRSFGVGSVLMAGMAGALLHNMERGDIVISQDLLQHDFDATRLGLPPGVIPGSNTRAVSAHETLVQLALKCSPALLGVRAYTGRILTGDQFVSGSSKLDLLRTLFNGMCVDMEGAAAAHVCVMADTPFVVIRCIAERSDSQFVSDYQTFSQIAAGNLALLLREMLNATANIPK